MNTTKISPKLLQRLCAASTQVNAIAATIGSIAREAQLADSPEANDLILLEVAADALYERISTIHQRVDEQHDLDSEIQDG